MKIVCSSTLLSRCPAMSIAPITSVSRPRAETGTKVVIFSVDSRKNAIACAFCADPAAAKRSFARPRDVGPARPEGSFRRDRVRPARDCWKRKSFKATCALDKISASARTKNRAIVSVLIARLGKSCQNVPAHFDDFPLKTGRAGNLYSRACAIHAISAHRQNS